MSTEHIAKHREDIVHRETTSSTEGTTTEATARRIETKLVILLAFLWIVQYIISLSSLFKLCFSLRVIRITVRMILDSKFSVCFLYLVFRGTFTYSEYLIVISFAILLLSYCYLCVTDNLVIERITSLYTIDNLTLLIVAHTRNHCDSLMVVDVEVALSVLILLTPSVSKAFKNFL